MADRRESKKRETRERISDVATRLFMARGFDAVTLDEVAVAAGVSKMTVLNYFARKEDLLLDRQDDLLLLPFREAIRSRGKKQSPVDALRAHVEAQQQSRESLSLIAPETVKWWQVVAGSASLKARLRELEDEAIEGLAAEVGDPLTAGIIVISVRIAREEATKILERGGSEKKANARFFELLGRGLDAASGAHRSGC